MGEEKHITAYDTYLFHEGSHYFAYRKFGAHLVTENGEQGVRFTVWAPQAGQVGVAGDFNGWQGTRHLMERVTESGIWSLFIPGLKQGELYKYEMHTKEGEVLYKADPYAFFSEVRPQTASVVYSTGGYRWRDRSWQQNAKPLYNRPLNIYEVHLGSWKRKENGEFLNYRELAHELADYVLEMGYTHIELLPVMEHPFDGSWGYQVTGYYSVTGRHGTPHDFMYFIDYCHQKGIGVILDWVPAHFCRDQHGLARFDGTPLYEGGESVEWGTYHFNYSRPEVISFLISNAIFWFEVYHIDGLRIDAVASMLYLDYGKEEGRWQPNKYGGRENLEAVTFIRRLNIVVFKHFPNALMIAEESTAWPLVTKPVYLGGLGFNFKWNMGWMNDCLRYFQTDPLFRKQLHSSLTFSLMYAFSENFVLPLSHDEVVHGKRSLIEKMPGDYVRKFANARLFLGYMMAHPGKKLLFMGSEFAQFIEWRFYEELGWKLLEYEMHHCFRKYVQELNHFYLNEKALWQQEQDWQGFSWIDADNYEQSIVVFMRSARDKRDFLVVVCNFLPVGYDNYRVGVPQQGWYEEVMNSDCLSYGGSGQINRALLEAKKVSWQNQPCLIEMKLPPLAAVYLKLR